MSVSTTPHGRWECAGEGRFTLDDAIPVAVYRWYAPERLGGEVIEFQCAEQRPERRFYPTKVLEALRDKQFADDYADQAARMGVRGLPEMEDLFRQAAFAVTGDDAGYQDVVMPTSESLGFLLAVFQTRGGGHHRVTRPFHREDDFFTGRSRHQEDCLVPGVDPRELPKGTKRTGRSIIDLAVRTVTSSAVKVPPGRPSIGTSPLSTPLDELLIEGFAESISSGNRSAIGDAAEAVAPALIDGINLTADSAYLADHAAEFRAFSTKLIKQYHSDAAAFAGWLAQERQKGFIRLDPNHKKLQGEGRGRRREQLVRFYRRLLWTSYAAMSRCVGVTALYQWGSFCQSTAIAPSPTEERAFRFYNAPLCCAGGLPLWFFGPNTLRWFLETFIEDVWNWSDAGAFGQVGRLLGLYAVTAQDRRRIDAYKKRPGKLPGRREALLSSPQDLQSDDDGRIQIVRSVEAADLDCCLSYPELPRSRQYSLCSGGLHWVGAPMTCHIHSWIIAETVCRRCGTEQSYRVPNAARPSDYRS